MFSSFRDGLRNAFREKNVDELGEHVRATYFNLRVSTGVLALLFPIVFWPGGYLFLDIPIKGSISAYYHSEMQSLFVGIVLVVGTILILYKGYSTEENVALNIAGFFAFLVAYIPTKEPGESTSLASIVHGISAVIFFLCIAYVCIWRARDTLDHADRERREKYIRIYRMLGIAMVVLPVSAAISLMIWEPNVWIFGIEFAAVWVFGFYWIAKSIEIRGSGRIGCRPPVVIGHPG